MCGRVCSPKHGKVPPPLESLMPYPPEPSRPAVCGACYLALPEHDATPRCPHQLSLTAVAAEPATYT